MGAKQAFTVEETHAVPQRYGANIGACSDGLGWVSAFASVQREQPFEGQLEPISDHLMVLHRGGPVEVTFKDDDRTISRQVPRGGIFFLPAGRRCEVSLRAPLDTIHIHLRAELFTRQPTTGSLDGAELTPVYGDRDPILEHLATAVGEAARNKLPGSSLFVDPIAQAIAGRFLALIHNSKLQPESSPRSNQLSSRQLQRVRDFVDANLDTEIRLNAMANACELNTDNFVRLFKKAVGVSPYQFVLGLRVERAKALLLEQRDSLSDIAVQCGFTHQEHMTRIFRRFTGVTPGRYRRGDC
jgi:AraC family transcriptional regulator